MLLNDLCVFLGVAGLGLTPGTNLFYGPLKEEYPDGVVVLQEVGGTADEPDLGAAGGESIRLESPNVLVIVRGDRDAYDAPRAQAEAVRVALTTISNGSVNGVPFLIAATTPPAFRRFDANFRSEFGITVHVVKVPDA